MNEKDSSNHDSVDTYCKSFKVAIAVVAGDEYKD